MALIKCPECGKEISDRAASCPNCGCPISSMGSYQVEPKQEEVKQIDISSNKVAKSKNMKNIIIAIVAIIVIAVIAVFVGVSIRKKNAEAKRAQQIQDVKNAMDKVDESLSELIEAMNVDTPFLYGDSASDEHKNQIKDILDTITENQRIVDDAYANEDREFVKELDDYISTNKTYRSWNEYNDEIKKLYGNSISNEQAADSLVKEIASTEEEYRDYKNHYFYLGDVKRGDFTKFEIDEFFDPEFDFDYMTSKNTGHSEHYRYMIDSMDIIYYGDKHPKNFTATFKLLGTNGNVIATAERSFGADVDGVDGGNPIDEYIDSNGDKHDISEVSKNGLNYGDWFGITIWFWSDINDTPTNVIMEVTSDDE